MKQKVKEFLDIRIPPIGKGLKAWDMFRIGKGRNVELKQLLDKKCREMMKPTTDLIDKLPKKATEENRAQIEEAMNAVIQWTMPRKFIEVFAEIEVRNLNEANYVVFIFTMELFHRINMNQNMSVELNNMLKTLKPKPDAKNAKS